MPENNSNRMTSLEKIRDENQRLKEEVYRLREEAREKDALISTLESQITALVVDGRNGQKTNDCEVDTDYDIDSHVSSVDDTGDCNRRNDELLSNTSGDNREREGDSDIDIAPTDHTRNKESTGNHREDLIGSLRKISLDASSVTPSLSPPRRSTFEMKHPPAPTRGEPSRRRNLISSSSRRGFQTGTAAIKALPRELSISNHTNYLNDDDDSNARGDNSRHLEQKQKPETYEVINTEFMDAYNSRGIYSGTVQRSSQMPHGKGKMKYHQGGSSGGRYYDGDWHVGHWHGYGVIRDADGDIYEGQVVNDLKEGIGTMQFTDGRIFQGEFRQDEASEGTMSYIDGAQYEGELHHGNRHGFGVYRFSDGSYYEGESVMNLFEGRGKMTWSDGGWYEGDWSRGEIHGFGKEYRPDGSLRHDGRWIKGVPIRTKEYR